MIETVVSVDLMVEEELKVKKNHLAPDFPTGEEKRICIVSGLYGDELQGQYICYEVIRRIKLEYENLTGIVDVYPALNPSSGEVVVDKKKIQLLTLGAGFDMELSAKENVYLNGAIIGYTKEFIDLHYDEIVSFAELDGFMDEKVKNFSSGMVSRLGFAIATVGDAAEILILDEVLSVGDEFFRKKSLSRVQELIHGGSTVLMVSHGIGTILKNCTKVVWIEKGKLQMVGNPDIVCAAYRSQHN